MKTIFATLLSLSLLVAPTTFADDAEKLAEVQAAIAELMQQLEEVKSQRTELETELEQSESSISDIMQRIEVIKSEIKIKQDQLGALIQEKKTS